MTVVVPKKATERLLLSSWWKEWTYLGVWPKPNQTSTAYFCRICWLGETIAVCQFRGRPPSEDVVFVGFVDHEGRTGMRWSGLCGGFPIREARSRLDNCSNSPISWLLYVFVCPGDILPIQDTDLKVREIRSRFATTLKCHLSCRARRR